ncbi:YugN family protein [Halalkalibacillus halophilus]|uniref:YugN family protein n=1 Tax=Halalkalibacillus halophilus TaxID=392827 RepID=UPI0003FE61F2|nr:YugN family protein [Halalkalibacillus halophilus]
MKIEKYSIEGFVLPYDALTYVMEKNGFVLAGQWDYERVTYDYKMNSPEKNVTYFLRINGLATEGNVDSGTAVIKLYTPLLGKHYYPHGVEYGEGEEFPSTVMDKVERVLKKVEADLKAFQEEAIQ